MRKTLWKLKTDHKARSCFRCGPKAWHRFVDLCYFPASVRSHKGRDNIFFLSPCNTRPSKWTLVKRVSECFGLICSTDQIALLTEPVFSCLFRFFLCEYLRVKMYLQFKGQDILASKESLLALILLVLQVFIIYIIYSFYEL